MSDDWDFYFCQVDNEPASIFVDLGIHETAPISGLSALVWLRLYMRQPRPDGLSSDQEFEALKVIEDRLSTVLTGARTRVMYVGRNTSSGCRDFYFYAQKSRRAIRLLETVMTEFQEYEIETGTRPDPSWEVYSSFLYPNERDRQMIENGRVLTALEEHGDVHSIVRPVKHWAYFSREVDRSLCADALLSAGFDIKNQSVGEGGDSRPFSIRFERESAVDSSTINEQVLDIYDLIQRFNGDYDGWETSAEMRKAEVSV